MTDDIDTTTHGATASSRHDDQFSALLGRGDAPSEHTADAIESEADCFPLDGVIHGANASTRARGGALRTRSADMAREVLALAEHEVRDLLAQDPLAPDWPDRSGDIVARAQRRVSEILAQGRRDAEVLELRAEADSPADNPIASADSEQVGSSALIRPELGRWQQQSEPATLSDAEVKDGPGTAATEQLFATLRAVVLPSEAGALRYRVSGQLTLATMLAFQHAVSRLTGVDSARVDPEPDDIAILSIMTNDSTPVQRLLERMPGVHLQMVPA